MKKTAALVETTRDRAAATQSGSTVFSVQQQQRVPSAQLKSVAKMKMISGRLLLAQNKKCSFGHFSTTC